MSVRVVRVRHETETVRSKIPFSHEQVADPKLEKGKRRVVQQGAEGVRVRRYATVYEDGRRAGRKLVEDRVERKPRDEIVKVGTGQPSYKGSGSTQEGIASWFHAEGMTAAHRTLPMGTVVKVTNLSNGKTVNVVIRDRGPFIDGRIIDLSRNAFEEIAPPGSGTARVRIDW